MTSKNRKNSIHVFTRNPYDKEERKNILSKFDVLFLLPC